MNRHTKRIETFVSPAVRRVRLWCVALILLLVLCSAQAASSEKQKARNQAALTNSLTTALPQPVLAYLFPAGGRRGTSVDIAIVGTNVASATGIRITGGGVDAHVSGTVSNTLRVSLTIAADATPGERDVRVIGPGGASNRARFIIGDIPEINEAEPNSDRDTAQRLAALPVVINGQVGELDRDFFRFPAKAGQTLVFDVQARRLVPYIADAVPGWLDACLTVTDSAGRQLASVDDFRFRPDPVLFFTAPKDGDYILELRDIIYRGRADLVYRLTVGALPYVTDIFPLGGRRGTTVPVALRGVNLVSKSIEVTIPTNSPAVRSVSIDRDGSAWNSLPFAAADYDEVLEAEPNDSSSQANRITVPCTVNGRIQKAGDGDWFVFAGKPGQRLVAEVQARRLDSPLDAVLTLFNGKGVELAENDDTVDPAEPLVTHHADSRIVFPVAAAGDYFLRIRDGQGKGGPEYGYRVAVAPLRPDFALRVSPDNPRVGPGDTVALTVSALRKDGFTGEIELSVSDLPAGFVASVAGVATNQGETRLTVTAPTNATNALLVPRVAGRAKIGSEWVTREAAGAESVMQAFSYTHQVPTKELLLSVIESAEFTLAASTPPDKPIEVHPGDEIPVVIKATRNGGLRGPIALTAPNVVRTPVAALTVKPATIAADTNEVTITVSVSKQAPAGSLQTLVLNGALRSPKGTINHAVPGIPIRVIAPRKNTAAR